MTVTVLETHTGLITNREVLEVVRARGADPQVPAEPLRSRDPAVCEVQVYEALKQTPALLQTREMIAAFQKAVKGFGLTKAETLMLVNEVPDTLVTIHVIVEDCEERFTAEQIDELLETVNTHLGASRPDKAEEEEEEEEEGGAEAGAAMDEG